MELAYELQLPVIIHCRDAANEMIEICNDLSKKGKCPEGVLHCWTGTPKEMKHFLDFGFYISFSGIVTFPKAYEIHEIFFSTLEFHLIHNMHELIFLHL